MLNGFKVGRLTYLNDAFLAFSRGGQILTSVDGMTWKGLPREIVPVMNDTAAQVFLGADYDGSGYGAVKYFSTDGASWHPITRPDPVTSTLGSIEPVSGGYVATTWDGQTQKDVLIGSTDGLSWSVIRSVPAAMSTILSFSGRLYGLGSVDSSGTDLLVWSSADGGKTWEQLATIDGRPMSAGMLIVAGNRLMTLTGGVQFGIVASAASS